MSGSWAFSTSVQASLGLSTACGLPDGERVTSARSRSRTCPAATLWYFPSRRLAHRMIETVDLRGMTDAGLTRFLQLQGLQRLHHLGLKGGTISGKGLTEVVRELRNLQSLDLGSTSVQDSDLNVLAQLPDLRTIYLDRTRV